MYGAICALTGAAAVMLLLHYQPNLVLAVPCMFCAVVTIIYGFRLWIY